MSDTLLEIAEEELAKLSLQYANLQKKNYTITVELDEKLSVIKNLENQLVSDKELSLELIATKDTQIKEYESALNHEKKAYQSLREEFQKSIEKKETLLSVDLKCKQNVDVVPTSKIAYDLDKKNLLSEVERLENIKSSLESALNENKNKYLKEMEDFRALSFQELSQLQNELHKAEKSRSSMKSDLLTTRNRQFALEIEIDELRSEYTKEITILKSKLPENESSFQLKDGCVSENVKMLQERNSVLEIELSELKKRLSLEKSSREAAEQILESFTDNMIDTRDLKKELNRTKNSLTIAERKLEKYNSEIDSYNNKIKDLEELNRNLKLDNEVLESFNAELSDANKKLAALTYSDGNGDEGGANTDNVDGFQSMGSESTSRIKEKTNPNRPVVEEEEYEKEVQNLKVKNEILEKEIDTLKIESEQTSKRLNISKDLISELKNKISDLSTKLQTSETKVQKLDEINQNKIREEVKLYKNLNEINMELELTKEELKDKNTTVNKLSQEILTQSTEINTLQSSLQNEKALSNKLQDDYNRWIEKRESSVKDSKYIENLVKENESLINDLNKFRQMTIPHLEYEVKDLKNTLLQSDMELADLKERHDMNLIDKSNLLALMNKNKLEANETIKKLESDIQKLLSSST